MATTKFSDTLYEIELSAIPVDPVDMFLEVADFIEEEKDSLKTLTSHTKRERTELKRKSVKLQREQAEVHQTLEQLARFKKIPEGTFVKFNDEPESAHNRRHEIDSDDANYETKPPRVQQLVGDMYTRYQAELDEKIEGLHERSRKIDTERGLVVQKLKVLLGEFPARIINARGQLSTLEGGMTSDQKIELQKRMQERSLLKRCSALLREMINTTIPEGREHHEENENVRAAHKAFLENIRSLDIENRCAKLQELAAEYQEKITVAKAAKTDQQPQAKPKNDDD